jgi:hypothetical protein
MIETNTILNERNINAIKSAVSKKAKASDESKLLSKYPVFLENEVMWLLCTGFLGKF